jgi:uncharacterized protein YjbI with pentapeptide repeats
VRAEMGDETITSNDEPDTKEAKDFVDALNHSAERVQTLWFSFLTFMLYLAVATGTTTHRMLFLEEQLNLPVLNIKLPLLGFYILTPIIFVVFHFYMLLNLVLLSRTAKSFEDALARAFPDDGEPRESFRMRIENTLFVQLLVGAKRERDGINARFLSLMALITLALAPVALMLFLEIKFLPYHSEWISWLHRGLLFVDLGLVWTLWPGYRSGWGVRLWPKWRWRLAWPGFLSAAALAYAVLLATFPDEPIYLATDWLRESHFGANARAKITPISTLDLHGEDLIDDEKLKKNLENNERSTGEKWTGKKRWVASLLLAGRDLTGANLEDADIQHIDFSGAILNNANLDRAWATNAHFDSAQLQGASLDRAQLQGASLDRAQLQGASLDFAQLQGASLRGAEFQGAEFFLVQLQGASLEYVNLEGASLDYVQFQGASLENASLQGAWFFRVQLQGATLDRADLRGASLLNVCAWRTAARKAAWEDTRVVAPKTGVQDKSPDTNQDCNWTDASLEKLKTLIADKIPEGTLQRDATKRIEQKLDPTKTLEGEDEMANIWAHQALPHLERSMRRASRNDGAKRAAPPKEHLPCYNARSSGWI